MRMLFIMLSLVLLFTNVTYCQTIRNVADTGITFHVEKQACRYRGVAGSCLGLHLKRGDSVLTSKRDFYTLKGFTALPDPVRLILAEKLLAFKGDTAMVGMPMNGYQYEGVFNFCYPVLYDAKDNREINDNPLALQDAYNAYGRWFQETKRKGVIEGAFAFNEGQRYHWLGHIERL